MRLNLIRVFKIQKRPPPAMKEHLPGPHLLRQYCKMCCTKITGAWKVRHKIKYCTCKKFRQVKYISGKKLKNSVNPNHDGGSPNES